ncbi:MAG TPA: transketolase C-terminal domain-containing protein [Minicystis sp.]|nr:transketolase C-terminal domain-containing protein [Minicystis sp.]
MPTYEDVMRELCASDDRIVVMTAENRAAIRNLPPLLGKRFIDVGICEQTMIAAAAGLALRGRIPVCHALATFLTLRAFEFIRTDVGIAGLPVKLVGGVPGFLSDGNGPTHQAIEDVSILRGIPGMHVVCPADAEELAACLPAIIASGAPTYVRHNPLAPSVAHTTPYALGKAEVLAAPAHADVAILTYGLLVREAAEATKLLEAKGTRVRLVNLRTLKPIDEEVLLAATEAKLVVTLEDHFLTGGLYSICAELFLGKRIAPNVLPIALRDKWFQPGLLPDVLRAEGFTGEQIAARITDALGA